VSSHRREPLARGWAMRAAPPAASAGPSDVGHAADWLPIDAACTVADGLQRVGGWSPDGPPRRLDAEDWWFRCRFPFESVADPERIVLGLDGLATVADVWLNGTAVLSSENMFHAHEIAADRLLRAENELLIRCRALDALVATRRPRPHWRAPLVEHQQLRWFRATLLGRTPGWSPPAPPVGPWRDVWLERRRRLDVSDVRIRSVVAGGRGTVSLSCNLEGIGDARIAGVTATLDRDGKHFTADLAPARDQANRCAFAGTIEVVDPDLWWPHTHGKPALYGLKVLIAFRDPSVQTTIDLGAIGFRAVDLDRSEGDFALRVNGVRVFCRGACWTPLDPIGYRADRAAYDEAIRLVRDAGMNMLRLSGATTYETPAFLDLCDENGILLWHDFMFANMDYPAEDEAWSASVRREVEQQLLELQARPCAAVLCGNSEASQQAAMWGAPREAWSSPLFTKMLPSIAMCFCPDVPYCPSSTDGGAFPHQVNAGVTSYFGVGAYLRPIEDARRSELRFASECLAFANIPEPPTIAAMPGSHAIRVHHPAWKARTPHDLGAGWDFDDIRDHYLASLFRVNPLELRYSDHERYLALGRVASGEVMAAAFGEWRRARSTCRGALVWVLRDLVPGAGWGVIDALGTPKAAYYYLRRTLQPQGVFVTDEGCNGLVLHVVNDSPRRVDGRIQLDLFKFGEVPVGSGSGAIVLEPHAAREIAAAGLFPEFQDLSYAFRFGPPPLDLAVATLSDETGTVLGRAFHFPAGFPARREREVGLTASVRTAEDTEPVLVLSTRRFAQSVAIECDGFRPSDQYFHMAPGSRRDIRLERIPTGPFRLPGGVVRPLNSETATRFTTTE
jgi:beta-mannosidase